MQAFPCGRQVETALQDWLPVLSRLSLEDRQAQVAARRALANRTGLLRELLASGWVEEECLFRAIAGALDLPFLGTIDPGRLVMGERHRLLALANRFTPPLAMLARPQGETVFVVATLDINLSAMRAQLARRPGLALRLRIAPPSALRAAILARTRQRLLFDARYDLSARAPEFCARFIASGWQGVSIGMYLAAFPICLLLEPEATLLALHITAAMAFCACIAMRILALERARPLRLARLEPVDQAELPVYSVLVTLYRETEVVPQLLTALGRLQWPRSKLEIKLICEADDHATLSLLRTCPLRPCIEIIEVPPAAPRTKPKALAYGLPLCSGEFVTLYDAEDRPHPLQLLEAWQRFRAADEDLACLQAPLLVDNGAASVLSRMFAFEYAALFRGILPWMARRRLALPLGGTSNHFRRSALIAVGGWDAYNVTEDADLGLRLARFGYRTGTITRPTLEEGPEELSAWLPQRVRWYKGYLQTWLVHMRNPLLTWRQLGTGSFVTMQILFPAMLVSALIHPIFLGSALYAVAMLSLGDPIDGGAAAMVALAFVNIAMGYAAFLAIGARTLTGEERKALGSIAVLTPFYWLLLSLAAWMALWEFYRRPHHWNKTPHRAVRALRPAMQATGRAAIRRPPPPTRRARTPTSSSAGPASPAP